MFQLPCPNCGLRNASEFRFGGEITHRPSGEDQREWADYVYNRQNAAGVQEEWWYHRSGCQRWFKARRNTATNEILDIL
ncbi:MAG TPA: sarcosine oxidase subunit delta [Anaerolineales bacterium]